MGAAQGWLFDVVVQLLAQLMLVLCEIDYSAAYVRAY